MTEWINVKDRLPENGRRYPVWDSDMQRLTIANLSQQDYWLEDDFGIINVTHWAELPEAPRD